MPALLYPFFICQHKNVIHQNNLYIFQNVIFPVQAVFKFGNEDITVDFNETKNYKLTVVLRD
jgi:hypothetical protein